MSKMKRVGVRFTYSEQPILENLKELYLCSTETELLKIALRIVPFCEKEFIGFVQKFLKRHKKNAYDIKLLTLNPKEFQYFVQLNKKVEDILKKKITRMAFAKALILFLAQVDVARNEFKKRIELTIKQPEVRFISSLGESSFIFRKTSSTVKENPEEGLLNYTIEGVITDYTKDSIMESFLVFSEDYLRNKFLNNEPLKGVLGLTPHKIAGWYEPSFFKGESFIYAS